MNDATTIPVDPGEVRLPAIVTGGLIKALVPRDLDEAYRVAKAIHLSGLAPSTLNTTEKVLVAVMAGMEIGFPPMQALQSIAVINGRPSIWGDAGLALIRASGLLESFEETIAGEGDEKTATCTIKRRGDKFAITRTFSVGDAKTAHLWEGRNIADVDKRAKAPWVTYPMRMLTWRARWWAMRDGFGDVLKGMAGAEEQQDVSPTIEATAAPAKDFAATAKEAEKPKIAAQIITASGPWIKPPEMNRPTDQPRGAEDAPVLTGEAMTAEKAPPPPTASAGHLDAMEAELAKPDLTRGHPADFKNGAQRSIMAELSAALHEAETYAEVKVVADEFAGVMKSCKEDVRQVMQAAIDQRLAQVSAPEPEKPKGKKR